MIKKILMGLLCLGLSNPATAHDVTDLADDALAWEGRQGLRFGYNYLNNGDDTDRLESPHMFAIGFELQQTMDGGDWLDLLFIENVVISGLEQSVIVPSVSGLVGFEVNDALQVAVGATATVYDPAEEDNFFHLVTAIGWTQQAGVFSVPIHFVYVPDINDYWRGAITTGVNW